MPNDEIQTIFRKNLKFYLAQKQSSQLDLANYLNVSNTTVNNWVKGYSMPRMDKVDKICQFFMINRSDLLESNPQEEFTGNQSSPKGIRIPVLGKVAAGIPIEAITDIEDWEEIPQSMAKTGEYFALKIAGKSMEPRMMDGDVVIVRRQPDVDNGDIAVVLVNGNDATVKQISKSDAGLTLIGWNPSVYTPRTYNKKECKELPVTILGKVVEIRGKL